MSDDLISREALKRKLQYVYSCDYIGSKSKEGIVSDIIDAIDNAPTIEAYPFEQVQELVKLNQQFAQEIENLKRPKGKWIPKGRWHIDTQCIEYTCSICGRKIMREESLDVIEQYPFCHCGADMRGDV